MISEKKEEILEATINVFKLKGLSLARMRDEGLIGCERQAQRIHYFITRPAVQQIVTALKSIYCP